MSMQILIVDDEPLAHEVMQHYISRTPGLELVGCCNDAMEAFGFLSRAHVDLLLLDINMPEMSGIDFLKSLKNPPLTIFTTAYPEYALTGFELDAVDYLMKPVPFERFLKAIHKAQDLLAKKTTESAKAKDPVSNIMFVRSEGKLVKIDLSQLWLVEGLKDYVRLWIGPSKIVVHSTMKGIEELLVPHADFLRVSKSYIVNLAFVTELDGHAIRIRDQVVIIGATYRDEVLAVFNRHKLM